jgi:hypothetical protein
LYKQNVRVGKAIALDCRGVGGHEGRRFIAVVVLVTAGWVASARGAWAEEGAPPAKAGGADASSPVAEGPQPPVPPPPPGPSPAEVALTAEQAELKATLDALQAELAAEREQRAEEVIALQEKLEKSQAALKEATERPAVTSAYGGLGLTGYVQADWGMWNQSSEDEINTSTLQPLNQESFAIRRARLRATVDKTYVAGLLELDGNTVNGTTARLIGAEASAKLPGAEGAPLPLLMASIGLFKIPFGYEVVQSDRDRVFLERSTAEQAMFPGEYDLGARLQGGWRFARYVLAVQNGEPLGEKSFPGRDPNAAKDFTGRVGVDTPISDAVSIAAGFSGLSGTGFHRGNPATKPTIQWVDRNEDGVLQNIELVTSPGVAATPSGNFNRFAWGADVNLSVVIPRVGVASLYGDLYVAKNLDRAKLIADPLGPVGRNYRELGAYVAALLQVSDYGTVGARYDFYNPDLDSTDPSKPLVPTSFSYSTLAFVAALGSPNARLQLEYDHNDNHQGRDMEGNPTTLKADTVTLRGQIGL